jgi:ribonuclease HI
VNKLELLKAVYSAIDWERLYRAAPDAERVQVDGLFQELAEALGPQPGAAESAAIRGGAVVLYCDGASRGNPGPAAVGVVLAEPSGRELLAWGEPIGRATNNVAEYRAAIAGLQKALELGARSVELRADSELLVHQISGVYRVKHPGLRPLHAKVGELLGRFERWSARHVPREANARADALADAAARKALRSQTSS